jgi:glucosamine 6-phosphate synthetase-like amidotransferase/phosphosugar isomerase protein
VFGSSRETHMQVLTHAGPEIGVASTKAFTTNHCFNNDRTSLSKSKGTLSHSDFHVLAGIRFNSEKVKKHWRLVI